MKGGFVRNRLFVYEVKNPSLAVHLKNWHGRRLISSYGKDENKLQWRAILTVNLSQWWQHAKSVILAQ